MVRPADGPAHALLPLLLSVPPGAVVGVPAGNTRLAPRCNDTLNAFGPSVRTSADLRHAARHVPARVVVGADGVAFPLLQTALAALRAGRSAVVLHSVDCGLLASLADRVLWCDASGPQWVLAEHVGAQRVLELRIDPGPDGSPGWTRIPLHVGEGAESILAAARADGVRVRESRVVYDAMATR